MFCINKQQPPTPPPPPPEHPCTADTDSTGAFNGGRFSHEYRCDGAHKSARTIGARACVCLRARVRFTYSARLAAVTTHYAHVMFIVKYMRARALVAKT